MAANPDTDADLNPKKSGTPGMTEGEFLAQFNERLAASRSHLDAWRKEARELYDMAAGRQWSVEDEAAMRDSERPMVTFNLISKFIDMLIGLQINNRQDIRYYPANWATRRRPSN